MKRCLVYCKDQEQWDKYVESLRVCLIGSLSLTFEHRRDSFILTDNLGNVTVYIKMIPCSKYKKTTPVMYRLSCDKIWLVGKKEWNELED